MNITFLFCRTNDIKDYWYVSQGKLTVPSIDDREDMQFANEAFDVLGFSEEMKYNVCTSFNPILPGVFLGIFFKTM